MRRLWTHNDETVGGQVGKSGPTEDRPLGVSRRTAREQLALI